MQTYTYSIQQVSTTAAGVMTTADFGGGSRESEDGIGGPRGMSGLEVNITGAGAASV